MAKQSGNPICCGRPMHAKGLSTSGVQRYRCPVCGKYTTGNPTGRPREKAASCPKCHSDDTKWIGGGSGDRVYCNSCQRTSVLNPQPRGRKPVKAKVSETKTKKETKKQPKKSE